MTWWLSEHSLPLHYLISLQRKLFQTGRMVAWWSLALLKPHYTALGGESPTFFWTRALLPLLKSTSETLADPKTGRWRRRQAENSLLRYLTRCLHQSPLSFRLCPSADRRVRRPCWDSAQETTVPWRPAVFPSRNHRYPT